MTVDNERFSEAFKSPFPFEYIAYAGSLSIKKDGIDILLKSYCSISEKFPGIHLVIIGNDSDFNVKQTLFNIVEKMPLTTQKKIHFTGLVDRKYIPKYLNNAKILVLARPDSLQAQAGIPSKLGEYLSTGQPVIVTETGEVSIYLTDSETAFLCPPGDITAFSSKLDFVLSNYSHALKVGLRGQTLAKNTFDAKVQAETMSVFLKKL
jgi:glycosyltransferase involved in cell wall biosynthesis